MTDIIKKKRGRKPKNLSNILLPVKEPICEDMIISEEEKIILHLPISPDKITEDTSMFVKEEETNTNYISQTQSSHSEELVTIVNPSININNVNKITTHVLNLNKGTKCWWCKNSFDSPSVQLPEDYYNSTFYCIGHFCSFNCAKSYNLDNGDVTIIYKRESLLNLLYYQTYGEYKEILAAPHWITLKEYGGTLSINELRKNSLANNKEYLVLHPPLISRQMQIEESYKMSKLKSVSIDTVNKLYSEADSEYSMKRTRPIKSNQLNLQTTMGLIKKTKK